MLDERKDFNVMDECVHRNIFLKRLSIHNFLENTVRTVAATNAISSWGGNHYQLPILVKKA
jgi:hypothetical protein